MKSLLATGLVISSIALTASAQDRALGDSKAATGGARPPQMNEGFIGRDVPAFDPGSEVMSYDGKLWNIKNNSLFNNNNNNFVPYSRKHIYHLIGGASRKTRPQPILPPAQFHRHMPRPHCYINACTQLEQVGYAPCGRLLARASIAPTH
ncbi:MAG: hypothetical protein ACKOEZ_13365 [Spartobacteria bacterium]